MNLRFAALASAFALIGLLAGCTSPPKGAGSGKYAAVELTGFSRTAVDFATQQVFENAGYKMVGKKNDVMTFEKPGSTGQNIMWGGLDKGVWERVLTHLTRMTDEDQFLLWAEAFRVESHGDTLLEDATKMGFAMQSKYQALLEKVRALLAPLPGAPGVGTPEK